MISSPSSVQCPRCDVAVEVPYAFTACSCHECGEAPEICRDCGAVWRESERVGEHVCSGLTIPRCAELAGKLDDLIDNALPGDDREMLRLVRRASRRLHDRIEQLQRQGLVESLVNASEDPPEPKYFSRGRGLERAAE